MTLCNPRHPMCESEPPCIYCGHEDYDGHKDFARSVELGWAVIRARKAAGGPGWQAGTGEP